MPTDFVSLLLQLCEVHWNFLQKASVGDEAERAKKRREFPFKVRRFVQARRNQKTF